MKNRRTISKQRREAFHVSSVISITLCIITMGLLIATCLNTYFVNRKQERNIRDINKLMVQISSNVEVSDEETLEDIYLAYYNDIDQKATDSINVALSFFGFIFSLVTIVNTIISVRIPKQFENSLSEIDDRIKEVERSARESTNAARYVNKKWRREISICHFRPLPKCVSGLFSKSEKTKRKRRSECRNIYCCYMFI